MWLERASVWMAAGNIAHVVATPCWAAAGCELSDCSPQVLRLSRPYRRSIRRCAVLVDSTPAQQPADRLSTELQQYPSSRLAWGTTSRSDAVCGTTAPTSLATQRTASPRPRRFRCALVPFHNTPPSPARQHRRLILQLVPSAQPTPCPRRAGLLPATRTTFEPQPLTSTRPRRLRIRLRCCIHAAV